MSRRLGDFLGNGALTLSEEELKAMPLSFYGISQGAILGAGYTEFSSLVSRENCSAYEHPRIFDRTAMRLVCSRCESSATPALSRALLIKLPCLVGPLPWDDVYWTAYLSC